MTIWSGGAERGVEDVLGGVADDQQVFPGWRSREQGSPDCKELAGCCSGWSPPGLRGLTIFLLENPRTTLSESL
jgi:hypothetical protein